MNHTCKSLVFVVEASTKAVRDYTKQLDRMRPGDRQIPAVLKAITTEADVLSSALSRLSNHVERLPDPECQTPHIDPSLGAVSLDAANKLFAAVRIGFCSVCQGVRQK